MKKMIIGLAACVVAGALTAPASALPTGKASPVESAIEKVGDRDHGKHRKDRHMRRSHQHDAPAVRLRVGDRHHHHRNKRYGNRHDRGADVEIRTR